jgi:hypothetical protein
VWQNRAFQNEKFGFNLSMILRLGSDQRWAVKPSIQAVQGFGEDLDPVDSPTS